MFGANKFDLPEFGNFQRKEPVLFTLKNFFLEYQSYIQLFLTITF